MSSNWNSPEKEITPEEIVNSGERPRAEPAFAAKQRKAGGAADNLPPAEDAKTAEANQVTPSNPEARRMSRRSWLGAAGVAAGVAVVGGSWWYVFRRGTDAQVLSAGRTEDGQHPSYPAPANPRFAAVDRPITAEAEVARHCNFYEFTGGKDVFRYVEDFQTNPWTIEVTGAVRNRRTYDMDSIYNTFTLEERIYRHRCVETWAMVVPWTGFPLAELVRAADPLPEARFVKFVSFLDPEAATRQRMLHFPWPYTEGLTLAEATNPLAFIATGMYGHPLLKQNGAPIRLVVPWKYGYKSGKSIVRIEFTRDQPRTFWNELQPREYPFESNVNPDVPHPRWSQASEKMLGTGESYPTQMFNGYGEWVADLYR